MPAARSRAVTRRVVRRRPALEDLRPAGGRHVGGGEHVLERQRHPGQRRRQLLAGGDARRRRRRPRPAPAPPRRAGTRGSRPSVAAIWSRQAWVTSTDDTSLAAILAPSVAASQPDQSSRHSALPQDPRAPRIGRRPASGACASASLLRQARLDDVGPGDVDVLERVVGGLDVGDVDGLDLADVARGWRRAGRRSCPARRRSGRAGPGGRGGRPRLGRSATRRQSLVTARRLSRGAGRRPIRRAACSLCNSVARAFVSAAGPAGGPTGQPRLARRGARLGGRRHPVPRRGGARRRATRSTTWWSTCRRARCPTC